MSESLKDLNLYSQSTASKKKGGGGERQGKFLQPPPAVREIVQAADL